MASLGVSELNVHIAVAGASVAALLRRLPNFIATGKKSAYWPRTLGTLRDLTTWRLIHYCGPSSCSMSGHRIGPVASSHFYSATKFAVRALTEGVRQELREIKSHIRVSVSRPEPTDQCHKSHNAPVPYPTLHHFGREMCAFIFQCGIMWDLGQVHCGITRLVYFFLFTS